MTSLSDMSAPHAPAIVATINLTQFTSASQLESFRLARESQTNIELRNAMTNAYENYLLEEFARRVELSEMMSRPMDPMFGRVDHRHNPP